MWAATLARTPGSRLLLKAGPLSSEAVRTGVARAFTDRGVGADRLLLEHHTPSLADHLAAYRRVDLALDTYPYCGTTTTCEALWMGVPVLTRVGETHASRVGLSLLTAVGLDGLCTDSADAYIDTAVRLATAPDELASARADLRARVAASPLTDAPAFAARFEEAVLALLSDASPDP
jgi:protein O-GlcNAc transferase